MTNQTLVPCLVNVETDCVRVITQNLLVLPFQSGLHDPDHDDDHSRKGHAAEETLHETGAGAVRPEVGSVNAVEVSERVADSQGNSLLLVRLSKSGRDPTQHNVVNAETEGDEHENRHKARGNIGRGDSHDEPCHNNTLQNSDVPGALVVATRSPRHDNAENRREEVRREGKDQGDVCAVAESPHNSREKSCEADGRKMKVVHEHEDPGTPVDHTLVKALPGADRSLFLGGVGDNAVVSKFSLLLGEPLGLQGVVRQKEEGGNTDGSGESALDDV